MALYVAAAVLGGVLLGWAALPPAAAAHLDTAVNAILAILVFLVGIDIGGNRDAWRQAVAAGPRLLLVPLAVAAGSLAGAGLAGALLGMPVKEAVAVGAGFGWYSLSGVLIAATYSVELGAIAFLANIARELMAFLLIPVLALRIGKLPAIAPGGATTMDSTLPLITKVTDAPTALIAFVSGLALTAAVPVIIPLILAL
ncbi:lysine exporter LysO family protein [Anaeroselena agilis]|uniref:Lysine exporter LysO family protein n=1 Tax=Anaeroselena agilis TaxID=3063788 RepID=A0ABU3P1P5_9FIRM|nr:lysine exporter LysO family protein [Selenomonadales bacterium 4137-cl]